jgi:hypothetical protein
MAELKTKPTEQSVQQFLNTVEDEGRRRDCFTIVEMMSAITNAQPRMWGSAIIGFGDRHYKYASGRELDWFLTGFSPRKANLTLYIDGGFDAHTDLMAALGKHKTGKGCLYIKSFDDIDLPTLKTLIERSVEQARDGAS